MTPPLAAPAAPSAPADALHRLLDALQSVLPDAVPAWLVLAAALLVVLLVALWVRSLVRRLLGWLFGRGKTPDDWDRELRLDLDMCPLPAGPPGDRRLTVYHQPARLRLVVVAPVGKVSDVDALAVEKMLDHVVPGLGAAARHDKPLIRVWPTQISQHGFHAAFHRNTPKAGGKGEPSRWVLLAGRAQVGRQPVMLGLGLWTDEPTTLDRLTLEQPHQWLDVLRLTA